MIEDTWRRRDQQVIEHYQVIFREEYQKLLEETKKELDDWKQLSSQERDLVTDQSTLIQYDVVKIEKEDEINQRLLRIQRELDDRLMAARQEVEIETTRQFAKLREAPDLPTLQAMLESVELESNKRRELARKEKLESKLLALSKMQQSKIESDIQLSVSLAMALKEVYDRVIEFDWMNRRVVFWIKTSM